MRTAEVRCLILPGYGDSGPGHWQSLWEASNPRFTRVVQRDWENPVAEDWLSPLEQAVSQVPDGVVFVAHSLACLLVAHWVNRTRLGHRVRGALLVGAPDPSSPVFPASIRGFDPVPMVPFPFPTWVVASSDDPFATREFSHSCARSWGAELVVAGAFGHFNSASGLGDWPWARALLDEVLDRADQPEQVVRRQFDAFNARDLPGWAATYATDAVQFAAPGTEMARGRDAIAGRMADRFTRDPAAQARLVRRTLVGTTVVDQEVVSRTYPSGVGHYHLVASYTVSHGVIQTASFVFGDPQHGPAPVPRRPQRWAVVFTDTPEMLAIRRDREPHHLAYLRDHRDEIVVAGGCRPAPGEPFVGGLWVVETDKKSRVVELVENDPYFVPNFRSYRVTTWGKALDGDVIL